MDPTPQFWIASAEVAGAAGEGGSSWFLSFKDVTSPTNERTMIASVIPYAGVGNTLAILTGLSANNAALLLSMLNSFAFDFVVRQKVQGQHINLYILEQIAAPPPSAFAGSVGKIKIIDFVRDRVLRLSYTASDLAGFARDLGYEGTPFPWDEEERLHLRCQLDALLFRLYGFDLATADYALSTFSGAKEREENRTGHYRTSDLILAYMRAHAAGDFKSRIAV